MPRPKVLAASVGLALIVGALTTTIPAGATPSPAPIDSWVANGRVWSIVRVGDRIVLGGGFTQLSPPSGSGVTLDPASGARDATFPDVLGAVHAVLPAAGGGWYVGGTVTQVGTANRGGLALIRGDGSVAGFNPKPTGGAVRALALSPDGSVLYLGGAFTTVKGQSRAHLAAVNAATGALLPWNPGANGEVDALAVDAAGTVYVGGGFTQLGGVNRKHLGAVAPGGGVTSWTPGADGDVHALALSSDGTRMYAGGSFGAVAGQSRENLAAISTADGAADPWDPVVAGGSVDALSLSSDGTTLYAGGTFSSVGGAGRSRLAAIDTDDASVLAWDPGADDDVTSLGASPDGTQVFAGGDFHEAGHASRLRLAALDATTGDADPGFAPDANAGVNALAVSANGARVFAGGSFTGLGGVLRDRIAAVDATTGLPIPDWNPGANGTVFALASSPDGSKLYAGGTFTTIGGQNRTRLAELDPATGVVDSSFRNGANNRIRALAAAGDRLYVGGVFTRVGGQTRTRLAAIDISTGLVDAQWAPTADAEVRALGVTATGASVFMGGDFSSISGTSRKNLASVDAITGSVTTFTPSRPGFPMSRVIALTVSPGRVYAAIGGPGGRERAFNETDGDVLWNLEADGDVQACTFAGGRVYIGGHFDTIGGSKRGSLAAADAGTGALDPWDPNANGSVWETAASGTQVFVGGDFTAVAQLVHQGYAIFVDV
jgi:hypothetical protein